MIYSYSSLSTYKQCPAKFNFAYLEKPQVPGIPAGPALERGSAVHDSVEAFLLKTNSFLHPDIHKTYGQFMTSILEEGGEIKPEWKWGITWEFEPCSYDDPRAMLHGFIDLLIVPADEKAILPLYEWKTGKVYMDPHVSQVHKYSIATMCHYPERPGVDANIVWFDQVDSRKIHYPKTMMFEYKPALRSLIGTIADATRFPPMPSFKCRWCKYSRDNGGPCQF